MFRIALIAFIAMLAPVSGAHAARSSSKVSIAPQSTQTDIQPPAITIISPDIKRSLKAVVKEAQLTVIGQATDISGVASVTVNGIVARLNAQGNFSADLLLKPGENQITVVALDTLGNKGTERFTLQRQSDAVAAPVVAPLSVAANGKNYALLIGINLYQQIPKLQTAVHDAKEVARVLEEQYGFTATLLLDEKATRSAIIKELNSIKNRLATNDRLLIYYAGHGWNDKETETSYWLPVDSEQNDPTNWLEAKTITDQLKRSQVRQVLVVADSCYSGTISRAFDPRLSSPGGTRDLYLQRLMDKPSRILIASGGNEPVSDSGGSGHSIFADVLLKALRNPFDRRFTAEELMARQIKEPVAGRSSQTPEYKVIRNSGHDGGDFVFEKIR